MKIFKFCKKYLMKYKIILTTYILISLAITSLGILSPYITGDFLDSLIRGEDISVILRFCAIFATLSILKILLGFITSIMYTKMQISIGSELNRDTIYHIQNLSLSFINKNDGAYLNQRVNNDSNSVIIFCITILQNIITNVVMFVVPFIILLNMNFSIAIIIIIFNTIYILLYIAFKKPLYKIGFLFKENQSKFFSSLYEQFQYIKLIKINSIQPEINKRLDKSFKNLKQSAIKSQKITYLFSSLDSFVGTIAQIALFVIGGIQILKGNFTVGMFTIFSSYFGMMISSSRYFFNLGASYQNTLICYNRLVDIYNQEQESVGTEIIRDIETIKLENLSFSYADKKIINDLNISFEKGKMYGIVGKNGTGKSTFINLILGLYIDEKQGNISYNGININDINMKLIRREVVAFSEQEPFLINDTIRYNLAFNNESSFSNLDECLKILNMNKFIENLDNGLDSVVNEKNSNISGGEKQKISILKVLLRDTQIMIFDEPTSALDVDTTRKFITYLNRIKRNKIIIIITHDDYIKNECDVIVEF